MVLVVICMLIIPIGITKVLDVQFRAYVEERLLSNRHDVLYFLQELYTDGDTWDRDEMEHISHEFMPWPVFRATVYDVNDNVVFDVRKKRNKNSPSYIYGSGSRQGDKKALSFVDEIYAGDTYIGKVRFLCIPFKDRPESAFLTRFNHMLYKAMAVMLFLAMVLAIYMSRRIGNPITKVTKRAYEITRGNYSTDGKKNKSYIREIQTLIDSVDRLGLTLQEQTELRKRLMGDIAHELRNPVAVVKSHLEAFEDGVWEATSERIRLTVEEIDRLSKLITGVEKLAIIEAESTEILKERTKLSEELEKTVTVMTPLYVAKNVKLKSEIQPKIVADMDMQKMRHVFENLLTNALRYTDEGGEVTLSLVHKKKFNLVTVSDTGIGISPRDLPHIFDRFYRADKSRARASGGMGIGLAIVKATVVAHGGEITVESEEGRGTVFTVKLPV